MSKTVGLAMLVRDEADTLPATLPPMLDIADACTIIDTGSTDNTPDIVRRLTGTDPIRRPWVNFAVNRTELLREAAPKADYTLMLDADHRVTVHGDRPTLDADSYLVTVKSGGSLSWQLPLLTRSRHPFEYRGVAHSYLASDLPASRESTGWVWIEGGPGASADKLERDYHALLREATENPGDPRTAFYLAETCRFTGRRAEALRWYALRTNMGGWDEEVYWSKLQMGTILGEDISVHQAFPVLADAFRSRPHRAEALRAMARLADSVADKLPLPDDDVLFVRPGDYTGGSR